MRLRMAQVRDADTLTEIAFRSKAYWGYSKEFMEACREDLTVSESLLRDANAWVVETFNGELAGFAILMLQIPVARLECLFVDPDHMGRGVGKLLFRTAVTHVFSSGADAVTWDADPYAVGFYEHLGAVVCGEVPSTSIPGRMLPLMRVERS